MFEQFFDSVRRATEFNVQMQQDLFKRWAALWPGVPAMPMMPPSFPEQFQAFQKKWAEAVNDLVKRQNQRYQEQFAAGLKQVEKAFKLAEVKDVETLRAQVLELWQKTIELLQQASEAQIRDFQAAVASFSEMYTKAA
jgi:hypothetical protein